MGEPEPLIDPETANADYGIKGALSFDKPVPQSVAKDLYEHKRDEIEREDAIARRRSALLSGGAARFVTSAAAGLLDPINLAAGFIPFVGEARYAGLLAEAGSVASRAGIRAGIGAAEGAAGMAALQPLEFALSRGEQEDYTMADALRSIAVGGLLGGGLHVIGGAVADRVMDRYRDGGQLSIREVTGPGAYRNPITQQLEDAGPEARETLLQGALAQTIEGRPVDVALALDAVEAARTGDAGKAFGATDDMLAAARDQTPDAAPAKADADAVMTRPSDELQAIHQQIADLERQTAPPEPAPEAAAAPAEGAAKPQPTEADLAMEAGEARAAAVERAASCISRGFG